MCFIFSSKETNFFVLGGNIINWFFRIHGTVFLAHFERVSNYSVCLRESSKLVRKAGCTRKAGIQFVDPRI